MGGGSGWGGIRELSCMAQGLRALEAQGVGQRWKTGPCYWPFADPPPPDALRTHPPTSPPVTPRPLEALPLPSLPFPQLQTGQTRKNNAKKKKKKKKKKAMTGQRCRNNCLRNSGTIIATVSSTCRIQSRSRKVFKTKSTGQNQIKQK